MAAASNKYRWTGVRASYFYSVMLHETFRRIDSTELAVES
jgi:hypothetical protein